MTCLKTFPFPWPPGREPVDDPRQELVARLLEYKRYKEAAGLLEDRARQWQLRFERRVDDLNEGSADPSTQPLREVELWDLVSAFSRVMRERGGAKPTRIRYDDTPISVYMERVADRVRQTGRAAFSSFFQGSSERHRIVGTFLAILELLRHHGFRAEQPADYAEIWILPPLEQQPRVLSEDAALP